MLAEAERFITKKKSKPIIFSLVICYGALCGFYFLYMTSLALAVYCVVRIIAVNGKFDIKNLFETCFKLLGWYLLGIGLSAPFLFQALDGYFFSERNSQEINVITSISGYIPSIVSLVNFGVFSINPRGYRHEFGITIFHWAATIYIFIKAITQRRKRDIQLGIGILLSVITVALPIFGYLFNGFGETNTRWYFLIEFLATVILAVVIDEVYNSSQRLKKIYKYVCILIVLNISANVLMVYSSFGSDLSNELIATSEVKEYTSSPVNYFSELTDDNEVYRIDHDLYTETNGRPDNIAMLNGYKGLSYWFSIINQNSQNYADFSAGSNLEHRSFGFGKKAYTSALAGTKYYCAKADNQELENNFTLLETIEFNRETWKLYKNNLYKGIVYECDRSEEYSLGIDGDFEKYNKSLYECIDSSNISNVSYSSNRDEISFSTVNNDKSTYNVAIMIPYHWAWKATINGEKTQVSKFNGMMSIEVPKGEHEIKLTYSPVVRNIGIIVFFISIMAAILCCALNKEMRNRDLVKSRGSAMAEVAGHATHEVPYL